MSLLFPGKPPVGPDTLTPEQRRQAEAFARAGRDVGRAIAQIPDAVREVGFRFGQEVRRDLDELERRRRAPIRTGRLR